MTPRTVTVPERLDEAGVRAMRAQLAGAVDASAIILEGVPGCFCLGMDFESVLQGDLQMLRPKLNLLSGLLEQLLMAPRPTLAMVDGPAFGGGLGLAAACDVVIASDRARFSLPEALYGLAPAVIRPALLRRLSPQRLDHLLFTCHSRSAVEAQALGLVDRIVAVEALEKAKHDHVVQLRRARSETVAIARRWNGDLAAALAAGVDETALALADPKVRQSLRAAIAEDMT